MKRLIGCLLTLSLYTIPAAMEQKHSQDVPHPDNTLSHETRLRLLAMLLQDPRISDGWKIGQGLYDLPGLQSATSEAVISSDAGSYVTIKNRTSSATIELRSPRFSIYDMIRALCLYDPNNSEVAETLSTVVASGDVNTIRAQNAFFSRTHFLHQAIDDMEAQGRLNKGNSLREQGVSIDKICRSGARISGPLAEGKGVFRCIQEGGFKSVITESVIIDLLKNISAFDDKELKCLALQQLHQRNQGFTELAKLVAIHFEGHRSKDECNQLQLIYSRALIGSRRTTTTTTAAKITTNRKRSRRDQ